MIPIAATALNSDWILMSYLSGCKLHRFKMFKAHIGRSLKIQYGGH